MYLYIYENKSGDLRSSEKINIYRGLSTVTIYGALVQPYFYHFNSTILDKIVFYHK